LIWTDHSVVTVDACWYTGPNTLTIVAVLDQALATRKSVLHSLAFALIKDSWVTSLSTCHWLVVLVLSESVSESVTDQDGLEVDVTVLVCKNLGGKDGNIMSGIRFTSDMEILCGIFGKLLKEEGKKCVDVLASRNGVAN
jgi:hypothetical protein